jgi:hypothetical protein
MLYAVGTLKASAASMLRLEIARLFLKYSQPFPWVKSR